MPTELSLRYGMNPRQKPAMVRARKGQLPFEVINGSPGYINLLDALNSWQLVSELKAATGLPAAASFKHVSPAGAAVAQPMSDALQKACAVWGMELSPLATAYARARGADRMSAFGDWAALSEVVDVPTARMLSREVSDGIIAPGYEEKALAILKQKKKGAYVILSIDPSYTPPELETREVFGVAFEQHRNDLALGPDLLRNIVTSEKNLPKEAERDLLLALITLKYTQSNSVCFAYGGQAIGVGAGQQSRIHCTRLAAAKADLWWLRQHPAVLALPFKDGLGRPVMDNVIDQYLRTDVTGVEKQAWPEVFERVPDRLTEEERGAWLKQLRGVSLGSDAFFPFRDNIDRAAASGVGYIAEPGGSIRDEDVIKACDAYGMAMAFTSVRLFHH